MKQLEDMIISEDKCISIDNGEDWGKRLDMDNLEAVCFSCHNKIHGG